VARGEWRVARGAKSKAQSLSNADKGVMNTDEFKTKTSFVCLGQKRGICVLDLHKKCLMLRLDSAFIEI
jgi:hypothetical protein